MKRLPVFYVLTLKTIQFGEIVFSSPLSSGTHVHMRARASTHTHAHMCMYMHVHADAHAYIYTMYTDMCTNTHTHTQAYAHRSGTCMRARTCLQTSDMCIYITHRMHALNHTQIHILTCIQTSLL